MVKSTLRYYPGLLILAAMLLGCSIPTRQIVSDTQSISEYFHLSQITTAQSNNHIQIVTGGSETFQTLNYRISRATESIYFSAYIFQSDFTGQRISRLLMRKAQEGLDVRLLLDAWGSIFFEEALEEELLQAGVHVEYFRPFEVLRPYRHLLRNHRRMLIVDGRYALTGGFAIQDVWADMYDFTVEDIQIWVQGPMVRDFEDLFLNDWCEAIGSKPDPLCASNTDSTLALESIPAPPGKRYEKYPVVEQESRDCNPLGNGCTGPGSLLATSDAKNPAANYHFFSRAISLSRQRIWMATPYFIPDTRFMELLRQACQRGVDVRLVMASQESIQEFPVSYVRNPYIRELLDMGARVFVFEDGLLHSKASIFDEELSIVGTSNLDRRSFDYNREIDVVSYDVRINESLGRVLERYIGVSRELTLEEMDARSLWVRILEIVWWPLTPQL